jgi:predicted nucleotide-binding protein (sugar kinase/HSP70/actin superfamily)
MQLFHGVSSELADRRPDQLFLPMFRSLPRVRDEELSTLCPMVQAAPDIVRRDLGPDGPPVVSPRIDFGLAGFDSPEFEASCRRVANELGRRRWRRAMHRARQAQRQFEAACDRLGTEALAYARDRDLTAVVVLGRPYTIYNDVLNSNVPTLLREQGVIAIPGECYRVSEELPVYERVFWGYGQRNLRAAAQIRDTHGVYGVWCSNYSCGPDSFNLHFFAHLMEGKPYAVIETDGHSGDAGTKTRIEAFLHCVRQDLESGSSRPALSRRLDGGDSGLASVRQAGETLLIPPLGGATEALAACFRGQGVDAQIIPPADREAIRLGRRHTSGKECFPMCVTLGSVLRRLEAERDNDRRFCFFMPRANGPCRYGAYNVVDRIVLERLGWADRVSMWSPGSENYFVGAPPGLTPLLFAGISAADMLEAALLDVRPVERRPGAAQQVYDSAMGELSKHIERESAALTGTLPMRQVVRAEPFGCGEIVRRAAAQFRDLKQERDLPTVLVVGEIYLRLDPASNDRIVERLEERGVRVRLSPVSEWFEYIDQLNLRNKRQRGLGPRLSSIVQKRIRERFYSIMAEALGWTSRTTIGDVLQAGTEYLSEDLWGEAILTIGGPVAEHREGIVDGTVSVGPLECMPSKIAESQLMHAAEEESVLSLSLPFNGDPVDPEVLDTFIYAVRERHAARRRDEIRTGAGEQRREPAGPAAIALGAAGAPNVDEGCAACVLLRR